MQDPELLEDSIQPGELNMMSIDARSSASKIDGLRKEGRREGEEPITSDLLT